MEIKYIAVIAITLWAVVTIIIGTIIEKRNSRRKKSSAVSLLGGI